MVVLDVTGKLHINMKAREWCRLPYPDHPKGCPNYGKRVSCPPSAKTIGDFILLQEPTWLICVDFNLALHKERMAQSHPLWSDRQAGCVLYWQSGVNAQLLRETRTIVASMLGTVYTLCPEAMGINVITTATAAGLPIKTKPTDTVYKISLVGYPV